MLHRISYLFNSGKNPKLVYYIKNYARLCIPWFVYRVRLERMLSSVKRRNDYEYIMQRVSYYNQLDTTCVIDSKQWMVNSCSIVNQKMTRQKVYYFDSMEYARWFSKDMRWILLPGDIDYVPPLPSIVKSRPIKDGNHFSVILNLNKIRHFIFVNDRRAFTDKADMIIFRGKVDGKPQRISFMQKFFDHNMVDCGAIDDYKPEWHSRKLTISEQLRYKFIMAIEGNDVASNLKWVMSSNSVAVMPRPTCETWFMEGTLIPDYHYIEVKPDFSDLIDKVSYYIAHPHKAQEIISHANEYVRQFRNKKRERIISLLVLDKYFRITNKTDDDTH